MLALAAECYETIKFYILEEKKNLVEEMFALSLANVARLIKQHRVQYLIQGTNR